MDHGAASDGGDATAMSNADSNTQAPPRPPDQAMNATTPRTSPEGTRTNPSLNSPFRHPSSPRRMQPDGQVPGNIYASHSASFVGLTKRRDRQLIQSPLPKVFDRYIDLFDETASLNHLNRAQKSGEKSGMLNVRESILTGSEQAQREQQQQRQKFQHGRQQSQQSQQRQKHGQKQQQRQQEDQHSSYAHAPKPQSQPQQPPVERQHQPSELQQQPVGQQHTSQQQQSVGQQRTSQQQQPVGQQRTSQQQQPVGQQHAPQQQPVGQQHAPQQQPVGQQHAPQQQQQQQPVGQQHAPQQQRQPLGPRQLPLPLPQANQQYYAHLPERHHQQMPLGQQQHASSPQQQHQQNPQQQQQQQQQRHANQQPHYAHGSQSERQELPVQQQHTTQQQQSELPAEVFILANCSRELWNVLRSPLAVNEGQAGPITIEGIIIRDNRGADIKFTFHDVVQFYTIQADSAETAATIASYPGNCIRALEVMRGCSSLLGRKVVDIAAKADMISRQKVMAEIQRLQQQHELQKQQEQQQQQRRPMPIHNRPGQNPQQYYHLQSLPQGDPQQGMNFHQQRVPFQQTQLPPPPRSQPTTNYTPAGTGEKVRASSVPGSSANASPQLAPGRNSGSVPHSAASTPVLNSSNDHNAPVSGAGNTTVSPATAARQPTFSVTPAATRKPSQRGTQVGGDGPVTNASQQSLQSPSQHLLQQVVSNPAQANPVTPMRASEFNSIPVPQLNKNAPAWAQYQAAAPESVPAQPAIPTVQREQSRSVNQRKSSLRGNEKDNAPKGSGVQEEDGNVQKPQENTPSDNHNQGGVEEPEVIVIEDSGDEGPNANDSVQDTESGQEKATKQEAEDQESDGGGGGGGAAAAAVHDRPNPMLSTSNLPSTGQGDITADDYMVLRTYKIDHPAATVEECMDYFNNSNNKGKKMTKAIAEVGLSGKYRYQDGLIMRKRSATTLKPSTNTRKSTAPAEPEVGDGGSESETSDPESPAFSNPAKTAGDDITELDDDLGAIPALITEEGTKEEYDKLFQNLDKWRKRASSKVTLREFLSMAEKLWSKEPHGYKELDESKLRSRYERVDPWNSSMREQMYYKDDELDGWTPDLASSPQQPTPRTTSGVFDNISVGTTATPGKPSHFGGTSTEPSKKNPSNGSKSKKKSVSPSQYEYYNEEDEERELEALKRRMAAWDDRSSDEDFELGDEVSDDDDAVKPRDSYHRRNTRSGSKVDENEGEDRDEDEDDSPIKKASKARSKSKTSHRRPSKSGTDQSLKRSRNSEPQPLSKRSRTGGKSPPRTSSKPLAAAPPPQRSKSLTGSELDWSVQGLVGERQLTKDQERRLNNEVNKLKPKRLSGIYPTSSRRERRQPGEWWRSKRHSSGKPGAS